MTRSFFGLNPDNPNGGLIWTAWKPGSLTLPKKRTVIAASNRIGRKSKQQKSELLLTFDYEQGHA